MGIDRTNLFQTSFANYNPFASSMSYPPLSFFTGSNNYNFMFNTSNFTFPDYSFMFGTNFSFPSTYSNSTNNIFGLNLTNFSQSSIPSDSIFGGLGLSNMPAQSNTTDSLFSFLQTTTKTTTGTSKQAPTITTSGKKIVLARNQIVDLACKKAKQYGVDERLVLAVIQQESGFNPNAVSPAGAKGLMQLMPSTAKGLGVTNPFDIEQNIDAGVRHLKKQLNKYNGNVKLALAAYNAGSGNVDKYHGIPPFKETQKYVATIYNSYQNYSVA